MWNPFRMLTGLCRADDAKTGDGDDSPAPADKERSAGEAEVELGVIGGSESGHFSDIAEVDKGEEARLVQEVTIDRRRRRERPWTTWKRAVVVANNQRAVQRDSATVDEEIGGGGEEEDDEPVALPTYSLLNPLMFRTLGKIGMGGPQYFVTILLAIALVTVLAVIEVPSMYFNYTGDEFNAGGNWYVIARFSLGHSSGFNSVFYPLVIVAFVKIPVFLVWLLLVRAAHGVTGYDTDKRNITSADYTSVVSGLTDAEILDLDKLKEWLSEHYGEVEEIVPMYRVRQLKKYARALNDITEEIYKLRTEERMDSDDEKKRAKDLQARSATLDPDALAAAEGAHRASFAHRRGEQEAELARLEQEKAAVVEKLNAIEERLKENPGRIGTGDAFVTFCYEAANRRLLYNQKRYSLSQKVKNVLFCRKVDTPLLYNGHRIRAIRVDEPSDVHYDNFELDLWEKVLRRGAMWTMIAVIIVLHFGSSFTLNRFKTQVTEDAVIGGVRLRRYFNSIQALIVILTNWFIRKVLIFSSRRVEGYKTETSSEQSLIVSVTLSQVFNAALIPVVVEYDPDQWYTTGGLAEQAWTVVLWNNVLAAPSHYLQSGYRLKRYVLSWCFIRNKKTLAKLVQCPDWYWSERYAIGLKGFYLAILFGTLNPMCYVISIVGLTMNFFMDYFLFVKVYKAPTIVSDQMSASVRWLFKLCFAIMILYSNYFYMIQSRSDFDSTSGIFVICYFCVSLIAFALVVIYPTRWFDPDMFVKKFDIQEGDERFGDKGLQRYQPGHDRRGGCPRMC